MHKTKYHATFWKLYSSTCCYLQVTTMTQHHENSRMNGDVT